MATMKTRKTIVRVPQTLANARKVSQRQKASREWETVIDSGQRGRNGVEYWENYVYEVTVRRYATGWPFGGGEYIQLGIASHDGEARHDWRDFQRIKNDVCGPNWEAIEIYPSEERLIDPSNYYMLWCAPFIPVGMFVARTIIDAANCVAPQRPWHPRDQPEMTEAGKLKVEQGVMMMKSMGAA